MVPPPESLRLLAGRLQQISDMILASHEGEEWRSLLYQVDEYLSPPSAKVLSVLSRFNQTAAEQGVPRAPQPAAGTPVADPFGLGAGGRVTRAKEEFLAALGGPVVPRAHPPHHQEAPQLQHRYESPMSVRPLSPLPRRQAAAPQPVQSPVSLMHLQTAPAVASIPPPRVATPPRQTAVFRTLISPGLAYAERGLCDPTGRDSPMHLPPPSALPVPMESPKVAAQPPPHAAAGAGVALPGAVHVPVQPLPAPTPAGSPHQMPATPRGPSPAASSEVHVLRHGGVVSGAMQARAPLPATQPPMAPQHPAAAPHPPQTPVPQAGSADPFAATNPTAMPVADALEKGGLKDYAQEFMRNGIVTAAALYKQNGRSIQSIGLSPEVQTSVLTLIRDYWVDIAAQHRMV